MRIVSRNQVIRHTPNLLVGDEGLICSATVNQVTTCFGKKFTQQLVL